MDDIERSIVDALARLDLSPADLARRRERFSPRRTPRAWCLAIRASDTRLSRYLCSRPTRSHPHEILLNPRALRHLCSPVQIDPPGEPIDAVARKLGTTRAGLLHARVAGVFQTHHLRNLNGPGGKPRPLLYCRTPLDPSSRSFAPPDPVWSRTAHNLSSLVPADFEQCLARHPHYTGRGPAYPDPADLHPEHPQLDPPIRHRKSLRLPRPAPDYVWYKWDGDTYLGYDKTNPLAKSNHEKHQRQLALQRTAAKRRRVSHPKPSMSQGSLAFRGWKWQCPKCAKLVNVLYLPLRAELPVVRCQLLVRDEDREQKTPRGPRAAAQLATNNQQLATSLAIPALFACEKCTRIRRFSRCDPNAWNEIIRYLTAGLLHGREVPRPPWWSRARRVDRQSETDNLKSEICNPISAIRKLPYTPRPTRSPSQRRPQIERLLLAGRSFQQIADQLALARGTILWHAQQVYKQHRVHSLPELLTKLGHPDLSKSLRGAHTQSVRARLLAGQSVARICVELDVPRMMVYNQRQFLKKNGVKLPDGRKGRRRELIVNS